MMMDSRAEDEIADPVEEIDVETTNESLKPETFSEGGEIMKKLLFLGLVAGAAAAVYAQREDIQRYLKIRNM